MGQSQALDNDFTSMCQWIMRDVAMGKGTAEERTKKRTWARAKESLITAFLRSKRISRKRSIYGFKTTGIGKALTFFRGAGYQQFLLAVDRALPGALFLFSLYFLKDKDSLIETHSVLRFHRAHEFDTQKKNIFYYTMYFLQAFTSSCSGHRALFLQETEPSQASYLETS
jgi:hypothetical protein